jgi:hypothetical protein
MTLVRAKSGLVTLFQLWITYKRYSMREMYVNVKEKRENMCSTIN